MYYSWSWFSIVFLAFTWVSMVHINEPPGLRFVVFALAAFGFSFWNQKCSAQLSNGKALKNSFLEWCLAGLAQGAVLPFYLLFAARCHRETIFAPIASFLLNLLGVETIWEGSNLYLDTYRHTMAFTSAPEKTGLLYLLLILAGGYILLAGIKPPLRKYVEFPLILFGYGILRYTFLLLLTATFYIHSMFWEVYVTLFSFLPLAALLGFWSKNEGASRYDSLFRKQSKKSMIIAGAVGFFLAFSATAFLGWQDYGTLKQGRILVDEYHSDWEWTTEAYDTNWFGERSGYNYYCFYDYMEKFYPTSRNLGVITPEILADTDIFIIKTPTLPFEQEEIDAIINFVAEGGGLYLIGDHTNVFGTSTNLNSISRTFGITYNLDCTYELVNGSLSEYDAPGLLAHPSVARLPHFLFATSCTLDAPWQAEEIMVGYGLKNFPVNYSQRNFFPEETNGNDVEFGLFLQSAGIAYGKGKVVAYTDSTVFSNFWMYMPGKPELLMLTLDWLNRENTFAGITVREITAFLMAISAIACMIYCVLYRKKAAWGILIAGMVLGCVFGTLLFTAMAKTKVKMPEPVAPMTNIVFDREYAQISLPDNLEGFLDDMDKQFATFYVWTQRLGYYPETSGKLLESLKTGDLAVVAKPGKAFRSTDKILLEVEKGAKLLVLDNMETGAYANSFLAKVGMEVVEVIGMTQAAFDDIKDIPLTENASAVVGGTPLIVDEDGNCLLAVEQYGSGVIAVFTDPDLMYNLELGDVSANLNDRTEKLSAVEFKMIRMLVEDY